MSQLSAANPVIETPEGFRVFIYEYEAFVDWQTLVELYSMQYQQEKKTVFREILRDFVTVAVDGVELKMSYTTAATLRELTYPRLKGIMG